MFLQATVDAPDLQVAEETLKLYADVKGIDYIEMGAPMVTHYGVAGLELFKKYVPMSRLYVDLKIIDFPLMETAPFIEEGMVRTSAMAVMNDAAFEQLAQIKAKGVEIFISTMGYPIMQLRPRVKYLMQLGFDYFICHGAGVTREQAFMDLCKRAYDLYNLPGIKLIAAGGIGLDNAHKLTLFKPTGLIVGRGLLDCQNVDDAVYRIKRDAGYE